MDDTHTYQRQIWSVAYEPVAPSRHRKVMKAVGCLDSREEEVKSEMIKA